MAVSDPESFAADESAQEALVEALAETLRPQMTGGLDTSDIELTSVTVTSTDETRAQVAAARRMQAGDSAGNEVSVSYRVHVQSADADSVLRYGANEEMQEALTQAVARQIADRGLPYTGMSVTSNAAIIEDEPAGHAFAFTMIVLVALVVVFLLLGAAMMYHKHRSDMKEQGTHSNLTELEMHNRFGEGMDYNNPHLAAMSWYDNEMKRAE